MRKVFYIFLIVIAWGLTISLPGCDNKAVDPPSNDFFVYSDTEAVHLALQVTPTFLPDTIIYKQIHGDLISIRDSFPDMAKFSHFENRPAGRVLIQLTASAASAYEGGTYNGLDSLIGEYDTISSVWIVGFRQMRLYFKQPYYADSVATQFMLVNGVESSSVIAIGGDGSRIFVDLPEYEFQFRWGDDCIAGCPYRHRWVYRVEDNSITLTGESGDDLPAWF